MSLTQIENASRRLAATGLFRLVLSGTALCCAAALAQPQMMSRDGYTLRSSTVPSTAIPEASAKAHGIDPAPGRGLFNVMVEKSAPDGKNLAAEVTVTARNLAGMEREVEMREARAPNGMVSYMGTFDFANREVLDFTVRAVPRGSKTELHLRYRERMPHVPS